MRKRNKLVYGVGINDADYELHECAVVDGRPRIIWKCPVYRVWSSMIERCYRAKLHERNPTYAACTVVPEWLTFSVFRSWMLAQPWDGNQLDKDILSQGNKVYSPGTCIFVPGNLNKFIVDCAAARGDHPIGVCWHKRIGKFQAYCQNPFTGRREHLGSFTCPDEAHEAWRARKHQHALRYANMQTDPRIAAALRARYAPTLSVAA